MSTYWTIVIQKPLRKRHQPSAVVTSVTEMDYIDCIILVQGGFHLDIYEKNVTVGCINFYLRDLKQENFSNLVLANEKSHNSVSAKNRHINLLSSRPNILTVINWTWIKAKHSVLIHNLDLHPLGRILKIESAQIHFFRWFPGSKW